MAKTAETRLSDKFTVRVTTAQSKELIKIASLKKISIPTLLRELINKGISDFYSF